MEVLPESYDERVSVLYSAIEGGLERLLGAARKKGVLHAPFGRPTPYSLYCAAGTSEYTDSDDSQSPQFVYDYGFNALGFLSDVLKKAHPEAVVERKLERLELFRELQRRAFFAQLQCADSAALRADAAVAAAGLACAPLTAPLSPNAVLVVVRPRCRGNLVVQISSSPDFTTELQTIKEPVTDVQSSCKVSISDLTPARQYYIRCCVEDESIDVAKAPSPNADIDLDEGLSALGASPHSVQPATAEAQPCFLQGPVGGVFETCRCWTLPAELPDAGEGEEAAVSSRPSSAVSESRATSSDAAPAHSPMFSLFLAGGMDRALTQHHTHTRSGVLQAWPALQLGAGFDMDSPALLPPAVDETDAWPPVLNSAAQHSIEPRPVISCLLGDVFPPPALGRDEDVTQAFAVEGNDMMDSKHRALFRLFRSSKVFSDPRSVLRNSSMLLAWNDASVGADVALKNEESVYKQWAHDKRKHDKKNAPDKKGPKGNAPGGRNTSVATGGAAPQLQRPPITPGLGALTELFPVLSEDEETRKLYKSVMVGQHVELLLLDMRRGYLGRGQSKWLKSRLGSSTATWKVVLSGSSFGRIDIDDKMVSQLTVDNQNEPCEEDPIPDDDAEPAGRRLGKSVSITRLDDLDEHGRFKDSLQALLFSLQKDVDDVGIEQASVTSQVHSVEKSLIATASVADSVDEPAAEVQHLTEQPAPLVDSRPWPERFQEYMQQNREQHTGDVFAVTSGIMFLTGSGSHTLEASEAKETAQRNGQAGCEPTLQSCFVSLYNPKSVGSLAYCAEVNVSGYSPAPGKTAALDQSLGAFCAYPPSRAESAGGRDVVCAVHTTANPSGTGLVVRLAASDTGAIVYEARFIVPPPILPTRARTECATPPPP